MEFQPVIMAAGRGTRMTDLNTAKYPKALLPVGNLPMVIYPVYMLERAGFEEAIVVVLDSQAAEIRKALVGVKLRLDFVSIPDANYWGTADSLRYLKDKVKRDLLIISCDLITDISIHQIANIHRKYDATVTMLLSPIPSQYRDIPTPGPKAKKRSERDFVGFDEQGDRVLFMASEADLDENIKFRKSVLKRHPFLNIKSGLTDCHMYIMKKWVVDFLDSSKAISSIKGELIPYLIKKQFSKPKASCDVGKANMSVVSEDVRPDIFTFSKVDEITEKIREMSTWIDHRGDMEDCFHHNPIRCYAHVQSDGFCVKANTVAAYNESNKQIPRVLADLASEKETIVVHPSTSIKGKSQVGTDCLVAEGAQIGEKTSVKRSIIGKHCTIGDKVKIANSVILDHVSILEGCNIQGSLIGARSTVNEKCELKDCIVGHGQNINTMGKFTNEAITGIDRMMEI
ncbi:translation initiation factor eIF-2B subunit gamma-like [Mizuhopecten yessoensis]|uniref:Translation initiation factor eIF2B subunit gamma n=1 Tax=Mizuhopecten yessoensis TaxID=6573 RepID=A0A210R627_MIZYE|nr:translation initiation factor eIF-2B subunit gamma-like [Mizuhopecten yessoensis]XP_021349887.1 translation initiation factor eIF-2B subunit gamma-like [Mizuhopecten yessoensis]OWF56358.1 Translation initiation factor eIF-2B subunit gamma [Mizuhopecten yessoensis]